MADTLKIADEISILIPSIARKILLEFYQSEDISQSQLLTLMAIYARGSCRLSELSQKMQISNPTASGLVERLVKNEFVQREADQSDRRAINITLTSKGNKLAQKFRKTLRNKWYDILVELPMKDQTDFIRILRVITARTS